MSLFRSFQAIPLKISLFFYFLSGYFPLSSLLSSHRTVHTIDFLEVKHEELLNFEIAFSFRIDKTGNLVKRKN